MQDPDGALAQIRGFLAFHATDNELNDVDTAQLVELVDELDDHLTNGGALPEVWASKGR